MMKTKTPTDRQIVRAIAVLTKLIADTEKASVIIGDITGFDIDKRGMQASLRDLHNRAKLRGIPI